VAHIFPHVPQLVMSVDTFTHVPLQLTPGGGQLLALQAGRMKERGALKPQHVSMAKMNNCNIALQCARIARDILGANGVSDEYPIVRHMMNLESVYTYEGTHDIHNLIIGQTVTGIPAYNPPMSAQQERELSEAAAAATAKK